MLTFVPVLEFDDEILLLQHEEIEAREFEALHESFEKHEFGELEGFSLPDYLGMNVLRPLCIFILIRINLKLGIRIRIHCSVSDPDPGF